MPNGLLEDIGIVKTDFLIAGAGPAGASLACFLASYGLKGIMVSAAPGTANTPRAHITNMAALECLRDIGVDQDIQKVACDGQEHMVHTRWCHSMAGEEYARIYSWGNDPMRKGDYEKASPCSPVDLPQTLLEPILVRHATAQGFTTRFDTTLLSFSLNKTKEGKEAEAITATLRDNLSGTQYQIRTKYLFGADGARSQVVKQLNLPLEIKPGQGLAINVLVKADLSHLVKHRKGNLHWVMQPDREHPAFGWMAIVRMVRPWNEWMFILFPATGYDSSSRPSNDEYLQRVKELIGDETPAEITDVSKWYINEIVAERYSEGNLFCLGDAVHRHPPLNGLGSNTCIQDAFNLAWKIAYVHHGIASPELLSTYSTERQPVGRGIVTRANQALRDHIPIWESLGMLGKSVEERKTALSELSQVNESGQNRRRALHEAVRHTRHEFHGLGIEMNQRYSGPGVYLADETDPFVPVDNPVLYYEPSTYPGCRLPHVWLNKATPEDPVSSIDLAGHGAFTLFTGVGGEAWKEAANTVALKLKVPLNAHCIGFREDWTDVYFEWERIRGVAESGVVLVRPDRFVAWRAVEVLPSTDACARKLTEVMRSILCLN
ncbi:FAD binding domain-containing protein [Aspergillus californicus]